MSKFTVIVNTYPNPTRNEDLEKCLGSLFKQTYQDFDILIVENFQDKSELEKVLVNFNQYKDRISVVVDPTKKLSFLFNLGWRNAKSEYLAYLADDAQADPSWLENIDLELEKDPKIAVVSGPVISSCFPTCEMHRIYLLSQKNVVFKLLAWPYLYFAAEGRIQKPGNLFESGAYSFGASLEESRGFERQEIDLATTTSMGIRRGVLEEVNGFDENFSFNHADGDLFIRIKRLGYKIIFNPKVIAHHNVRIGPSRNAYIIGLDTGKFYRKDIRPKSLRGWTGAFINICVLNFYWIYNFLRTGDIKQLKGINGFLNGLFSKTSKENYSEKETKGKLKILMFNRWVGYNEGGTETHIKELAVYLSKQGHSVDILTTGKIALKGITKYLNHVWNVKTPEEYFSYSSMRFIYSLKYLYNSFKVFYFLIKVKKIKYDVVTVHFSIEAFLMRFIRAFFNIPYVLILPGDTALELIEGRRANNVSQLTHFMADECKPYGYYPKILTKGVDRERFNTKVNGSDIRKKYITNSSQFLVLTVCRLDPRKNLETLVSSASILNSKYPDKIKFVIIGGGVEENKLKKMINKLKLKNVVFMTGSISSTSDILPKYYSAADVFALPTLYEGFGYVFSEAMAFGLPVISTITSAVPEVIGDVGILIPTHSPKALSDAIELVYLKPEYRKKLSKKSIRKVDMWYWDVLISKYEEFILEGIEDYRNGNRNILSRIFKLLVDLVVDSPKIVFSGLKPLLKSKDVWRSASKEV